MKFLILVFLGCCMSTSFRMCFDFNIYFNLYTKCSVASNSSEAFRSNMYTNDDIIFRCTISVTNACVESTQHWKFTIPHNTFIIPSFCPVDGIWSPLRRSICANSKLSWMCSHRVPTMFILLFCTRFKGLFKWTDINEYYSLLKMKYK